MFNIQPDDTLAEIGREISAIDLESTGSVANARTLLTLARLPGAKARIRYTEGQDVHIVAMLPGSIDPKQIELHAFVHQGEMRVTYLRPFGRSYVPTWNTLPFHAQPLADGW